MYNGYLFIGGLPILGSWAPQHFGIVDFSQSVTPVSQSVRPSVIHGLRNPHFSIMDSTFLDHRFHIFRLWTPDLGIFGLLDDYIRS